MESSDRRGFIKMAVMGAAGIAVNPELISAKEFEKAPSSSRIGRKSLKEESIILFQGDSITDAGRNREAKEANIQDALGGGFVFLAAAELLNRFPEKSCKVYNRGISGNKVYQLADRWQTDCIDLKPSVISILIGVNDYWHKHNGNYSGNVEIYERDFKALLNRTRKILPAVKLVICEPFAVLGCKAVDGTWFPEFDLYRASARKMASEFDAIFIPYHEIFARASKIAPPTYWTADGVHPTVAGAKMMAEAWIKYVFGR
ncbi:MAG: SGNH/GDSL hydrolase family protein [Mariniphaga sp.]